MQGNVVSRRPRRAARRALVNAPVLSSSEPNVPLRVLIVGIDLISSAVPLIASLKKVAIMAQFASVLEALTRLNDLKPHVALLSLKLPDAIVSIQKIRRKFPRIAVLLVGDSHATIHLDALARSGAAGLLALPLSANELRVAFDAALEGEFVLSHSALEAITHTTASSHAAFIRERRLNQREARVLDLLGAFLQNKEIADQLTVSIPVAEKLVRNVFRKLHVRTRAEAIVLWKSCQ